MITQPIQGDPAINFEQLEDLIDKNSRETQRSIKNKATQQHYKIENALNTQIGELKDQNKNKLRAALFGLFMKMASMASNFIPVAGPFIATILSTLAQSLNPFNIKAENAQQESLVAGKEAEMAKGQYERLKGQADEMERNREIERQGLEKAMANLAATQSATVRV